MLSFNTLKLTAILVRRTELDHVNVSQRPSINSTPIIQIYFFSPCKRLESVLIHKWLSLRRQNSIINYRASIITFIIFGCYIKAVFLIDEAS